VRTKSNRPKCHPEAGLTPSEEFGIYLNYVRKLGFEETPDYDFLRELFAKVMKNNNDIDDGVFDWNLLNGVFSLKLLSFVF
jgi:casein kinase 1